MKKKILALILTLLMVFSLAGCGNNKYPKVTLYQDVLESSCMEISIGSNYKYKDYEKVINEDGSCSLIINFEKEE